MSSCVAASEAIVPAKPAWRAVYSLGLGVFGLITAEFLPASLLTPMAASLGVTEGMAGQAVTATALVALVTGLLITPATKSIDRCWVLMFFSVLQIISIEPARFDNYRRNADFIQKYIFPGGMLPSPSVLKAEVERAANYEHLRLPLDLDYTQVSALSFEARQKLQKHKPETLGQASRISGITPASISLLLIHLKRGKYKGFADVPTDAVTPSESTAASA